MNALGAGGAARSGILAHRVRAFAALAVLTVLLAGCGLQIPADPEGTEQRVRGGTLHVGATHNPPWAEIGESGAPAGSEVGLVERFAAELDADVEWTEGSEASLVDALERGELDLVVGGFLDDTPWQDKAAVTRWYAESENARGDREKHVMLARMGENRFLVTLETFLDGVGQ